MLGLTEARTVALSVSDRSYRWYKFHHFSRYLQRGYLVWCQRVLSSLVSTAADAYGLCMWTAIARHRSS
ncbi:MAG: hypothetical protein AAF722_08080 [Cyanobacteria bacterium P01_C01_bin.70]